MVNKNDVTHGIPSLEKKLDRLIGGAFLLGLVIGAVIVSAGWLVGLVIL